MPQPQNAPVGNGHPHQQRWSRVWQRVFNFVVPCRQSAQEGRDQPSVAATGQHGHALEAPQAGQPRVEESVHAPAVSTLDRDHPATRQERVLPDALENMIQNHVEAYTTIEKKHAIREGHRHGAPHYAVHSRFINGRALSDGQIEREKLASPTDNAFPKAATAIDRYALDTTSDRNFSPIGPMASLTVEGDNVVPNIHHWIWMGSNLNQRDLAIMNWFALNHPDHDLNLWTDDPATIRNSLNEFAPVRIKRGGRIANPVSKDFENIADFKARLKIQDMPTLFKDNGLSDEQNKALSGIYLRERNGPLRNYAAVSDVVRLMTLLKHGGVYFDVDLAVQEDVIPRQRQMENLAAPAGLLAVRSCNNALAATRHATLVIKLLEEIIDNYRYEAGPLNAKLNALRAFYPVPEGDVTWVTKRQLDGPVDDLFPIGRVEQTLEATGPALLSSVLSKELGADKKKETYFYESFDADAKAKSWS